MFVDLTAFVINLDRATDRLAASTSQLKRIGVNWQRVVAVDGAKLNPSDLSNVDLKAYARSMGRDFTYNEFACAFSHLAAMKQFLATEALYGIIFEDDLSIPDDDRFSATLTTLVKNASAWDIVKLGGIRNPWAVSQMMVSPQNRLAAPVFKCTGAVAYIVNRSAARQIVENFFPITAHFDHQLDQPWRWKVIYRVIQPWVVDQNYGFASTIGYSNRNFPFYKRYTTLIYRMTVSLRRLRYNIANMFFLTDRLR